MTGLLGWGGATEALADCDLLFMLGTDFPYHAFLPAGKTIIQIDDKPLHLGRRAAVDLGLVGDVGETLRALIPLLDAAHATRTFLDKVVKHHHNDGQGHPDLRRPTRAAATGLRPEMVATALSDLAEDDAVFTVDTGMCNVWGARYLQMKPGRRILASFSHGSMANAMPQAIGAKVGSPDRQVIALCGDGGFSMLMGELLTAAGLDIPVKLMVFNNSTLGMVRAEMMVVGYQPWGTDVKNPDFGALATAAGIHGERVEKADDIRPAIERAFAHPGPGADRLRHRPARARRAAAHDDRGGQGLRADHGQARLHRRRRRGLAAGQVQHPRRRPGALTAPRRRSVSRSRSTSAGELTVLVDGPPVISRRPRVPRSPRARARSTTTACGSGR